MRSLKALRRTIAPSRRGRGRFSPYMVLISSRRGWTSLAVAIFLGTATASVGILEASVPTASEEGASTLPLWRVLAMGVAVLPAIGLHSHLFRLEEVGTDIQRCVERRYTIGLALACASSYVLLASLSLQPSLLAVVSRSLAGWLGIALISGRLLGWRLAWILPLAILFIMAYWGGTSTPGRYVWWDFTARPYNDLASLLLTACLFGGGLIAYWATPWRRKYLASIKRVKPAIASPVGSLLRRRREAPDESTASDAATSRVR